MKVKTEYGQYELIGYTSASEVSFNSKTKKQADFANALSEGEPIAIPKHHITNWDELPEKIF